MPVNAVVTRFWSKVDPCRTDGCYLWVGSFSRAGYGHFSLNSRTLKAHRFAYELLAGPISDKLTIDHLCRNRACVYPKHLEPVTIRENILRSDGPAARAARKTHCPAGHLYSPENVRIKPSDGGRECRECERIRGRAKSKARWAAGIRPQRHEYWQDYWARRKANGGRPLTAT